MMRGPFGTDLEIGLDLDGDVCIVLWGLCITPALNNESIGACMSAEISRDSIIEDLVTDYPDSITFLMEKGIRCLRCGEPIWGTLGSAMDEKDFPLERQLEIVQELSAVLATK